MSTHVVEVVPVVLEPHPNADSLSIVRVYGWQAVVRTAEWEGVALGAYIPPDSIIPDDLCPELPSRRIRAVRLRGEISEGLLVPAPPGAKVGDDVMAALGVTHYEPVPDAVKGADAAPGPSGYIPTYDVENARRYSKSHWTPGETLLVTEKLHGESWRATFRDGRLHVSSRTTWKREVNDAGQTPHFWSTVDENVRAFLADHAGAILYGELYGDVGGFPYDTKKGERRLRFFDVWADAKTGWWSWDRLHLEAALYGLALVPELGRVVWGGDLAILSPFAEGASTLNPAHVREGAVIRPLVEARPTASPADRPVLKLVGRQYLMKKEKS